MNHHLQKDKFIFIKKQNFLDDIKIKFLWTVNLDILKFIIVQLNQRDIV